MNTEDIARVAHDAAAAIDQATGSPSAYWSTASNDDKWVSIKKTHFYLDTYAGPAAAHTDWMRRLLAEGWNHGFVYSEANRTHPNLVPFNMLNIVQQAKEWAFSAIVGSLRSQVADRASRAGAGSVEPASRNQA
jgi:hypothetical protein